jgi:hypothetical protein
VQHRASAASLYGEKLAMEDDALCPSIQYILADVDVIWKHYNFAVYGGRKP